MTDIRRNFNTVEAVECVECNNSHLRNSDKYITLYGNLCIGESGGIIGGSAWDEEGVPVYIACKECFMNFIAKEVAVK